MRATRDWLTPVAAAARPLAGTLDRETTPPSRYSLRRDKSRRRSRSRAAATPMITLAWAWIPITLAAALAQTVRNAAQRSLVASAGTLAATFVRFVYGLPFALVGLAVASLLAGSTLPAPNGRFVAWVIAGAGGQLVATALLLAAMKQRAFVVSVAYSKTEVVQVALLSIVLLREGVTAASPSPLPARGRRRPALAEGREPAAGGRRAAHRRDPARPRLGRELRCVGGRLSWRGARPARARRSVLRRHLTPWSGRRSCRAWCTAPASRRASRRRSSR